MPQGRRSAPGSFRGLRAHDTVTLHLRGGRLLRQGRWTTIAEARFRMSGRKRLGCHEKARCNEPRRRKAGSRQRAGFRPQREARMQITAHAHSEYIASDRINVPLSVMDGRASRIEQESTF
jgi:hypothetical protein